jgi:acyl-CoA hydrolase
VDERSSRPARPENGRLLFAVIFAEANAACFKKSCSQGKFKLEPKAMTDLSASHPDLDEQHDCMKPRPVRDSQSEMTEIVLPNDANPLGSLLGGRLMHWIDVAGAMAAHRHSRSYAVTASIDHMDFLVPVQVGDIVILRSSVNRVFRTSMEIGVKVWVESYIQDTCQHVSSAYLTFVAVDKEKHRVPVAAVIPETDAEQRRYEDAGRRREIRRSEAERRRRHSV